MDISKLDSRVLFAIQDWKINGHDSQWGVFIRVKPGTMNELVITAQKLGFKVNPAKIDFQNFQMATAQLKVSQLYKLIDVDPDWLVYVKGADQLRPL